MCRRIDFSVGETTGEMTGLRKTYLKKTGSRIYSDLKAQRNIVGKPLTLPGVNNQNAGQGRGRGQFLSLIVFHSFPQVTVNFIVNFSLVNLRGLESRFNMRYRARLLSSFC